MDSPKLQHRWKCAVALLAGVATFAAAATEPLHTAQRYSIRGSLDEVPSPVAPRLTPAATVMPGGMSMSRDGYTLAAHLAEVPLECAGDEIFANGFD
jgi:hypothetical protein